jgi:uncharacterized DUF497 family protein
MHFAASARKHGVPEEDALHAMRHPLAQLEQSYDGESRMLVIGPDRSGRLLEIVVVPSRDPDRVIHVDAMRPKFYGLLP